MVFMNDFALPSRRTVMGASAVLGSTALLAACGDGHSEADTPEPSPLPSPSGESQVAMKASDLAVGSRGSAELKRADGGKLTVLLFRKDEQTVLAYSNVCTHQGCAVMAQQQDREGFFCPCHGSSFSPADGTVTGGPAIAALGRYATEIKDGNILVYTAGA